MGAGLVKAVFACWGHLDPMPKLLLVRMAVSALDDDTPPMFWGGRTALATAIGRDVPDAPPMTDRSRDADLARKARRDAFKAVERAVQALTRSGAVVLTNRPGPGERGCYELRIMPRGGPRSVGASAPRSTGGGSSEVPPVEWTKWPPLNGGPRRKPQEEKTFEEKGKEDGSPQVGTSPTPTHAEDRHCELFDEDAERQRQLAAMRARMNGRPAPATAP